MTISLLDNHPQQHFNTYDSFVDISTPNDGKKIAELLLSIPNLKDKLKNVECLTIGPGKGQAEKVLIDEIGLPAEMLTFIDKKIQNIIRQLFTGSLFYEIGAFSFLERSNENKSKFGLVIMIGLEYLLKDQNDSRFNTFFQRLAQCLNPESIIVISPMHLGYENEKNKKLSFLSSLGFSVLKDEDSSYILQFD
jgi:hypothetical protein